MTDALHDRALVMARKIAAEALVARKMPSPSYEAIDVAAGKYDEHSAVQSALAAILATTERAAKLAAGTNGSQDVPNWPLDGGEIARALRSAAHLKDPS